MRTILQHPLATSVTTKNGIISKNGHGKNGHDQPPPPPPPQDDDVFLDDHECDNVVVNIHQQQYYSRRCDPLSPPATSSSSSSSFFSHGWFPCHCLVQRVMTGCHCGYCTTRQRQQQPILLLLKPLLMAQVLSFLLASSGAANASLHFECNVSAPILQAGMVYLGLVIYSLFGRVCLSVVVPCCCRSSRGGEGGRDSQEEEEERMMEGQQQQQQQLESMEMAVTSCNTAPSLSSLDASSNVSDKDSIAITSTTTTTTTSVDYIKSTTISRNTLQEQQQPPPPNQQAQYKTMSETKSCLSQIFKVQYASLKLYAFMAFLDVEANYLIYLSFRYTTLTSVSLLDALAIPSAMVFSKLILRRKYYPAHVIGAAICIVGMAVNVFGDYNNKGASKDASGSSGNDDDGLLLGVEADVYPHKLRGDVLAMGGAVLYGLNNVLTERVVKGANHVHEYLCVLGCFGTMYCAIQSLFLKEIDSLSFYFGRSSNANDIDNHDGSGQCHPSEMWMLWFGSATLGVLSYTGMAHFLAESEAALLNLSLLTGDLWAALFIVVVERILPTIHFWMSLVLIVMGVCVYEVAAPSPMEEMSLEPL